MRTIDDLPEVVGDLTDEGALSRNRRRSWAVRSERGVEILSYDAGMQVLEHPDFLKGPSFQYRLDELGITGEARRYMDMGITNKEGAERRQMRAAMAALFRPSRIAALRQSIRAIARDVLDQLESGQSDWNLMDLCWQIPARTYCDLVSIPHSEAATVIRIADSVLGTLLKVDVSRRAEAEAAIFESIDLARKHLDARRGDLGSDFTSVLIQQQQSGLMTEDQLLAQTLALLQASVDNTAHQMGNVFGMLLSHPERWNALVRDRSLLGPIIEEGIRLHPRFGTIFRLAAKDTVIDDLLVPEGTWAFVSTRAGQRDPQRYEEPDEYRLDRPSLRPLMFGAGPYNCLGQNLARMEIEEALSAIADRFPDIRLAGGWSRRQSNAVSETLDLPVALGAESETPNEPEPVGVFGKPVPERELLDCEVVRIEAAGGRAVTLELKLRDPAADFPEWEPGAHIDLLLSDSLTRQYSLCGDPRDRSRYQLAVQREAQGAGGSAFVHDRLRVGDRLGVGAPRNHFALEDAPAYRFVAAGIGITAILPMVRSVHERGGTWSLVYIGKSEGDMALMEQVHGLPSGNVTVIETSVSGRPSIDLVLGEIVPGALLYACGPEGLIAEIADSAWPEDAVRFERFTPDRAALAAPSESFTVTLARSQRTMTVAAESTILDTLEEQGISWPYSCREGTCGSCEMRIVSGRADHRDAILTPAERQRNEAMMICVSRAETAELVLEA